MPNEGELSLFALMSDPSGVDQMEFLYLSRDHDDGVFRTWPIQWSWWKKEGKRLASAGSRAIGKALDVDQEILTQTGWKTMGTLQVGDRVFGSKGHLVQVSELHDVITDHRCFRVTTEDDSFIADMEHLWPIVDGKGRIIHVETEKLKPGMSLPVVKIATREIPSRKIVSVEEVDPIPVRCIEVVSDDHIFLVGRSFTPTHNSMSIMARSLAFPFIAPGMQMIITAPDQHRLELITKKITKGFKTNKIFSSMVTGMTKRDFEITFANNAHIVGAIPREDGTGMQGLHAVFIEHDEASDYPDAGWVEMRETLIYNHPLATWRCHGVSMGPGTIFDEIISGRRKGWDVERLPAMLRPNWNLEEREAKIEEYGGADDYDFKRNIYGTAEGAESPLVIYSNLMKRCVDTDELSEYNTSEYYLCEIDDSRLDYEGLDITEIFDPPSSHYQYATSGDTYFGMDYGQTESPSCITVWAKTKISRMNDKGRLVPEKHGRYKLIARVMLKRIETELQIKLIMHMMNTYRPKRFCFDKHGTGRAAYEWIQFEVNRYKGTKDDISWMQERIHGYGFANKYVVGIDDNVEFDESIDGDWERAAIYAPMGQASLDMLRKNVDGSLLWLPDDKELIADLRSAPRKDKLRYTEQMKPTRKKGQHILDSVRFAIFGWEQEEIDNIVENLQSTWQPTQVLFLDQF